MAAFNKQTCLAVNNLTCLPLYKVPCTFVVMRTLGFRLREEREAQQLTHGQLAYRIKALFPKAAVTQQSLSQLETGKSKRSSYIVEIATTLGLNPTWLLHESGAKYLIELTALDPADAQGLLAFMKLKADQKPLAARFFNSLTEPGHDGEDGDENDVDSRPKKRRPG